MLNNAVVDAPPVAPVGRPLLRSVMGRLSRANTIADVDADALVRGIDAEALPILHELVEAQLAGDSIDGLKARLRALPPGKDQ